MRRPTAAAILLALAGALLAVGHAQAARGVNLSWSRCAGEGLGTSLRAFACDTNVGGDVLVASFELGSPLAEVSGNEVVIDLVSQDDPLPAWWEFRNPGTCRLGSLSMNLLEDPADVVCADWQQGLSTGGIGAYSEELGMFPPDVATRHRKLKIALAVPPNSLADLLANTEYFSCNVVVDHAKTVGTGACGGCAGSVCLVLTSITVTTPVLSNDVFLLGGTSPGSDMAHWQGSGANCLLVPAKNATWGQVKALYR